MEVKRQIKICAHLAAGIAGVSVSLVPLKPKAREQQDRQIRFARQLTCYLSHVCLQFPASVIGRELQTRESSVRMHISSIEERRESAKFDETIQTVETLLDSLIGDWPLVSSIYGEAPCD